MILTIYRGTHEIGGSCVELSSESGSARIIIDAGLPLVNADKTPFDWNQHRRSSMTALFENQILPRIEGLYEGSDPSVSAVLLSHAHLDHYGLFRFVHRDIPLHMSQGTRSLAEVSDTFLDAAVKLDAGKTFAMGHTFTVGEFTIVQSSSFARTSRRGRMTDWWVRG